MLIVCYLYSRGDRIAIRLTCKSTKASVCAPAALMPRRSYVVRTTSFLGTEDDEAQWVEEA